MARKKPPHAHYPTDEIRAKVSSLYSFGHTQEQIATYLDISVDTLDRHYRRELDTAVTHANSMVANSLFKKATDNDDLQAQIFWLKTRGKWRSADSDAITESQDDLKAELKLLREQLDKKSQKDY